MTWHGGTSWDSRQVRHGSIHMRICARGGRGIPLHHPSSHMDHGMFLVRMLVRSLQSIECAALTNTHTLLFDVSSDPHSGKCLCVRTVPAGQHVECCPEAVQGTSPAILRRRKGPDRERVLRRMTEPNSHAGARSAEPRFRQEPACVTLVCAYQHDSRAQSLTHTLAQPAAAFSRKSLAQSSQVHAWVHVSR